jgi:hypothetical protein
MILLFAPLVIAPIWGSVSGLSGEGRSARLTTFAATRPLNNVAIVAAKYRVAARATLTAWGLVLGVVAVWVLITGGHREFDRLWEQLSRQYGRDRLVAGTALTVVGTLFSTWRTMAVGLWAGLTGRAWVAVVQTGLFLLLAFQGLYELAMSHDPERRERVLALLPWLAGTAVAVKFAIAGWALRSLNRRGELSTKWIGGLAAAWVATTAALFVTCEWLFRPAAFPAYRVAIVVVLFVPAARLALAPLALAWDRHR